MSARGARTRIERELRRAYADSIGATTQIARLPRWAWLRRRRLEAKRDVARGVAMVLEGHLADTRPGDGRAA